MLGTKAFRKASCGVYLVTATKGDTRYGCVINTFVQVTSKPAQASIAINKENATTTAVLDSGYFGVSILSLDAPMELIGRFGFKTSTEVNKFAETEWHEGEAGTPVVTDHAVSTFVFKVAQSLDVGSHMLVIGEAVEADVVDANAEPLTYADYHLVKGGKTPPKASSYEGDAEATAADAMVGAAAAAEPASGEKPKYAWRCTICGHIEYVDELPDDFTCPLCGVGKELFERIEL